MRCLADTRTAPAQLDVYTMSHFLGPSLARPWHLYVTVFAKTRVLANLLNEVHGQPLGRHCPVAPSLRLLALLPAPCMPMLMLHVRLRQESIARLEARVAALRAELADARRAAQAAAAAPAARDAVWARGPSPHRSKAERGAGRAERSAVSLPPDGDDAHSGAAGSEEVSLFDEEEDIFVGESPAVRLPNMEPTEAWSPADAGGGDGAWEGPADDPSDGGPGVGGREPGGGAAAPSCASAGSAREVEPEEEEDSDLTRPGNGSDAEAGASPTSAHAGKREAAAPGQHPNSGSAGSDAPTRGFALAEGTAGGGIQRHAHSWVPEPRPAGKENRSAAAPAAAGRPRLPKRQLTSLYDGEGEAACGAERPGKSVLGASALRAAPGFAGGSDRNPFLRRGAAPAERSASEVGSMLAECGLVEGLSQAPLPPIRSVRPGRPAASFDVYIYISQACQQADQACWETSRRTT